MIFSVLREQWRALLLLAVLLVAAVFGFWWFAAPQSQSGYYKTEDYWRGRIQTTGAEKAYLELVNSVDRTSTQLPHMQAHIFGAALFKELGADGVVVCDDSMAYGCLHEMFERIINEYGVDGLEKYVDVCKRKRDSWHPCHHALGHGLIAYYDYSEEALKSTLDICKNRFYEDPINGCVGGAFMEFNLYLTTAPVVNPRPVGDTGWFYPCTAISGEFQQACYFWLPQWWRELMKRGGMSGDETFKTMGEKCRALPRTEYRQECIERVGQHASYESEFNVERAKELCDIASGTDKERFLCRTYSAFSFRYTHAHMQAEALEMCSGLADEQKSYCETFARNEANVGTAPPMPDEFSEWSE